MVTRESYSLKLLTHVSHLSFGSLELKPMNKSLKYSTRTVPCASEKLQGIETNSISVL